MRDPPGSAGRRAAQRDADSAESGHADFHGLRIELLGGFIAEADGEPLTTLRSGRVQELLAFLLLHRGVPQPRPHIAFQFWPDTSDAQAQANLRTLVHRLRRSLPEPDRFLRANARTLVWREDGPCRVDVAEFEADTGEDAPLATLRHGIELFRGELLPHLHDPWVESERERLHRRFARAVERACRVSEAHRDYAGAIELARRLVRHEPFDEAGYRRLMRLYALANERSAALRVFRECEDVLQRELGVDPGPATGALHERLLANGPPLGESTAPQPRVGAIPLIGRYTEFERLQREWRDTLAGAARLVIVAGEPGIGKTRLAAELADWLAHQGVRVAWGRAYASEGALAYAPIVPWVRSGLAAGAPGELDPLWLAELGRVLPELATGHKQLPSPPPITEPGERERFADALVRGVLARSAPVLLVLDDMQWCSPEALGWIHYLLRTNASEPVLVVGTVRAAHRQRNVALTRLIDELDRQGRVATLELAALGEIESQSLAAAVTAADAPPPAEIYGGAAGNPLFIVELVRFHEARSSAEADQTVPPTVSGVIRARLAQLSDAARDVLRCAAVIGRRAPMSLIGSTGEMEGVRFARAVDELRARGILIVPAEGHFEIAHDLIRDHAYAEIGPTLRRHLHGAAARALERSSPEPGTLSAELGAHFDRAGRPGPAVRHYLDAATFSLRTGASDEALRLLHRARELTETDGADPAKRASVAFGINERIADILYLVGRYAESRAVLEAASRTTGSSLERGRLARRIGKAAIGERDFTAALEHLDAAAGLLGAGPETPESRREWLQVQLDRMSVLYWLGDWRGMEEVARSINPVLETSGSAEQRRHYDWQIVGMSLRRERYVATEEMVALARGVLHSTMEEGYAPRIAVATFHLAFVLLWHGDLEEARKQGERALDLAGRTGDRSLELRCLTYLAVIGRLTRNFTATRAYAERAEVAATAMAHRQYLAAAQANQAWLAWRSGDRERALALGRAATAAWDSTGDASPGFMFEWLGRLVMIAVILQRRGAGPVAEAIEHAQRLLDPSQMRLPDPLAARLEESLRKWESGDRGAARACLREALTLGRAAKLI